MLRIEVKKGNINRALKEMKFKFRRTKQLQRIREIQYFQKPLGLRWSCKWYYHCFFYQNS